MQRLIVPIFALTFALSAAAQTAPPLATPKQGKFSFDFKVPEKGEVNVRAEYQSFVRSEYHMLEGDVVITYGDVTIHGDRVTYNERTGDVVAEGNVVIDQGTRRLSAVRMVYNLASETGTLFTARGSFEPSIYFRGETIEKVSEDTYELKSGVFTSCDIDDPAWSFRVDSGTITVDDYARLRNVSFRAGPLPMFWTPYIIWPTKRDRAQGFLTPRVGFDSRLGSYLGTSYFIPLGQSADTTLIGDIHTKGFYGLGTDTRYVPKQEIKGNLKTYAVTDPENDSLEWKYSWTHTQDDLPGGFRGVIDIRDYSDLDFFRFFEREYELNTISNIYSSAYLTKNRPGYSLNIRTDRREYFTSGPDPQTFEQLPSIQFATYPNRIGRTPLYFAMESSVSHLRSSNPRLGEDGDAQYFRADVFPTLSLQVRTPSWFSIKPQVSLRDTWYTSSRDPLTSKIVDESLNRSYGQAQVEATGPSLSRIFNREIGGFSRFKHVIEPRARYVYTSEVEDQNRVIRFDTVDSPYLPLVAQSVEYSLVNRLIGKEKGENGNAREIMSFTLKQSMALDDFFVQFVGGERVETDTTPITANLHFNPYQSVGIDADAVFGNVTNQLDQFNLSANVIGRGGERFLNFTWFTRFLEPGQTTGDSSQFRVSTGLPIWKDRLRLDAAVNWDAKREEILDQRLFARFSASCYNIGLEFRDFLEYRPEGPRRNTDYRLSIDLKNVGSFPINLPGSLGGIFQ